MRYTGGKMRQGPAIADKVEEFWNGEHYYEPFMGALGSAIRTVPRVLGFGAKAVMLSDVSPAIVTMWRAVLFEGWEPPEVVTKEEWLRLKEERDPTDPLTAFAGFGASFMGMYFSSYAKNKDGSGQASQSRASTLRKRDILAPFTDRIHIECRDYRLVRPVNQTLYLDPPYEDRTKVHSHDGAFDSDAFWAHARALVKHQNVVLVSGFIAPSGWVPIHSWGDTIAMKHKEETVADEQIFVHESQA